MATPTPTRPPLPLTTTFIPPPDCTTDNTLSYGLWQWLSVGARDSSTCFPSGYKVKSYFSPGVCPTGYSAGGLSYVSLNGKTETHATCCPTGWNPQTGTDWPWYVHNQCTSSKTDASALYTYTLGGTPTSQMGVMGVNAKGISIRWQSNDFTTPISTPASTLASNTPSTGTDTATGKLTSNRGLSTSNSGLSTGAKAGIGVGVSVGVIMAMIIVLLVYRLRKTRKSEPDEQAPMSVAETSYLSRGNGAPVELDSEQSPPSQQGQAYSSGLSEMDAGNQQCNISQG